MLNSGVAASAFRKAAALLSDRGRVIMLVQKFGRKLLSLEMPVEEMKQLRDNWMAASRLLMAYVKGSYRDVSAKSLTAMTAGILYFVNPLDLVPDVIPLTGFVDDFSLMVWIYHVVESEIRKFRQWEELGVHR